MEPNENQLSSYYHHQHHHQQQQHHHHHHHQSPTTTSPTNGLLPATHHLSAANAAAAADGAVYPHSVPSAAVSSSPLEPARRKRGRPRKYGTPEEALAAKKASTASSHSSSSKAKKEQHAAAASSLNAVSASPPFSGSAKKPQFVSLGNAGQGFAPHVINVAAGEDVGQKIMLFMQQSKREICILSASGSISNASLRQPATSGGNITYEGRFDIVSLCGSYVRTDIGGKTGGLSVCLSSSDGHIVGGGVGGPLKAAGPVQVIVGTFVIDPKKEVGGVKGDASAGKLPSPVGGTSISGLRYGSTVDSSGGNQVRGNDDHQGIGESHFLLQSRGVNLTSPRPTDWRTGLDASNAAPYDLTGRTGHQSPENGDYDQIPD